MAQRKPKGKTKLRAVPLFKLRFVVTPKPGKPGATLHLHYASVLKFSALSERLDLERRLNPDCDVRIDVATDGEWRNGVSIEHALAIAAGCGLTKDGVPS